MSFLERLREFDFPEMDEEDLCRALSSKSREFCSVVGFVISSFCEEKGINLADLLVKPPHGTQKIVVFDLEKIDPELIRLLRNCVCLVLNRGSGSSLSSPTAFRDPQPLAPP